MDGDFDSLLFERLLLSHTRIAAAIQSDTNPAAYSTATTATKAVATAATTLRKGLNMDVGYRQRTGLGWLALTQLYAVVADLHDFNVDCREDEIARVTCMNTATAAVVFGVVFTLAGLAGLVAAPPPPGAPPLTVEHGHGLALGIFPVNTLHNLVHLLFGVLGFAAARNLMLSPRGYFQVVSISYALLTLLGLIPATYTTFGLVPIWGADVWLHLALAAGAAYFGFGARVPARA